MLDDRQLVGHPLEAEPLVERECGDVVETRVDVGGGERATAHPPQGVEHERNADAVPAFGGGDGETLDVAGFAPGTRDRVP